MNGAEPRPPGRTQDFVAARGFERNGEREVLIDGDGLPRVFFELTTDPDHPHSDPAAAYESLLSTLEPGATIRFLQIFWPDEEPRLAFLRQAADWPASSEVFRADLQDDLTRFLGASALPYLRRTILEIVLAGDGMGETAGGAVEILRTHGLEARTLAADEVQELARWVFNPMLD